MSRTKIETKCLFCGTPFRSTLRWEGVPEHEYCSKDCERQDEDYGSGATYEKFTRTRQEDEW